MKTTKFKEFISEIQSLNTLQQRVLKDVIHTQEKKKEVSLSLETDSKDILCPHCKSLKHTRWGKRNDLQRYKCSNCNKTFNSLSLVSEERLMMIRIIIIDITRISRYGYYLLNNT